MYLFTMFYSYDRLIASYAMKYIISKTYLLYVKPFDMS